MNSDQLMMIECGMWSVQGERKEGKQREGRDVSSNESIKYILPAKKR